MLQEIGMKVVNNVDAMLGYWDRNQTLRFANSAYKIWFGRDREEIIGVTMKELLGPLYEMSHPHILEALKGHPQSFERPMVFPDGTLHHTLVSYHPDVVNGIVCGFSVQAIDITHRKALELELKLAKEEAESLAAHDFLTGLPNRVPLMDRIQQAIARARRENVLFAVIAIDIDGFKAINDTHGHHIGDCVLVEIARRMKGAIRGTDTITRFGGDEFIFLVDSVDSLEGVGTALHRLLEAVCHPLEHDQVRLTPSLSCGVALFPRDGANEAELMAQADSALYRAKRQGRNCFVFAQPLPTHPRTNHTHSQAQVAATP